MTKLNVSDHAVLRYLERQWGVDVDGIRARIARIAELAHEREAESVVWNGSRFVLRGDTVVTVMPAKGAPLSELMRQRKGKRRK